MKRRRRSNWIIHVEGPYGEMYVVPDYYRQGKKHALQAATVWANCFELPPSARMFDRFGRRQPTITVTQEYVYESA